MKSINEISSQLAENPEPSVCTDIIPEKFEIIGVGSLRITVKHPDNKGIIKFGVGHGVIHNENEVKVYKKSEEYGIEENLATVYEYDSDYKWIKMQYIGDVDEDLDKFSGPKAEKIYDTLQSNGIILREIETTTFNGNTLAYDFGALRAIRD